MPKAGRPAKTKALPDLRDFQERDLEAGRRKRTPTISSVEAWWVEKARSSPYYFTWYMTGLKPALHHEIWFKSMFDFNTPYVNIVAARDSAKSTISIYALVWLLCKFPYLTFGIIAVSSVVARDRLSMIRSLFTENSRFKNVFPEIRIDKQRPDTQDEFSIWSESDEEGLPQDYTTWRTLVTLNKSQLTKNPSIFAAGNGGRGVIGRRISGILLLDDMVDETFLSVDAQNKMMRYINQTLIPCITEGGRVWNIGTRWMLDDIYEQLGKNEQWKTITIPAILYDKGVAYSYWPEYWPLEKLEQKRLTMNDDVLFRIMYLCDPSAVTAMLFRRDLLFREFPTALPEFTQIFISTDLSVSEKASADWNVLFLIGVDSAQNVYILDGMRFKDDGTDTPNQIIYLADVAKSNYGRLDGIIIEKVGFQIVFKSLISKQRPDLPMLGVIPVGDKMHRAKAVSYWALKGRLHIRQDLPFIDDLRSEWFNFPKHKHDDTLDAISIFFQHMTFGQLQAQLMRIVTTESAARIKKKDFSQLQARLTRLRRV